MNHFCGKVDRRKAFNLIYSWDHCQRSSPSQISDTPRAGFESAHKLSSGFDEWSCAVVITTTLWRCIVFGGYKKRSKESSKVALNSCYQQIFMVTNHVKYIFIFTLWVNSTKFQIVLMKFGNSLYINSYEKYIFRCSSLYLLPIPNFKPFVENITRI